MVFEKEVALPQEEVNPFILLHRCRAEKTRQRCFFVS